MTRELWTSGVNIQNFRNFRNIQFSLGKRITLISGQNGSGKSNLLSLIASASGLSQKSELGSNFQPEFYDFSLSMRLKIILNMSCLLTLAI